MENPRHRRTLSEIAGIRPEAVRYFGRKCHLYAGFYLNTVASVLTTRPAVIESISKRRDPQPDFEAVYLLMPTTQNVDRIIRDFSQRKQYAAAHLFFIEGDSCFPGPRKQVILTAFRIIRTSL